MLSDDILIIEDSGFFVRAYSKVLADMGCRVLIACDGQSGLSTAEACRPNLIILDLLIPGIPGIEVLRELKRNLATCHIPVLVVSSLSEKNSENVIREGALAFCEKTRITAEELEKVVVGALRGRALIPDSPHQDPSGMPDTNSAHRS